jgi:hypothetical protein
MAIFVTETRNVEESLKRSWLFENHQGLVDSKLYSQPNHAFLNKFPAITTSLYTKSSFEESVHFKKWTK